MNSTGIVNKESAAHWLVSRAQANLPGKMACGEIQVVHHSGYIVAYLGGIAENLVPVETL